MAGLTEDQKDYGAGYTGANEAPNFSTRFLDQSNFETFNGQRGLYDTDSPSDFNFPTPGVTDMGDGRFFWPEQAARSRFDFESKMNDAKGDLISRVAPLAFGAGAAGLFGAAAGAAAGAEGVVAESALAGTAAAGGQIAAGADLAGLAQMAADLGLEGDAAAEFVASGGTLGSTAAGGGGVTSLATGPQLSAEFPTIGDASAGGELAQSFPGAPTTEGAASTFANPAGIEDPLGGTAPGATGSIDAGSPGAEVNYSGSAGGPGVSTPPGEAPADVLDREMGEWMRNAPTTPPGTGNKGSDMQSYADKILKYGPLALGPLGMLNQKSATKKAAGDLRNVGATQRGVGEDFIRRAQAGQLLPSDQYAIDQWRAAAIQRSRDFFARAGLSDSSQAVGAEAEIGAKAEAMRQKALENMLTLGMQTLNATDKYQIAAIEAEMQGDQQAVQAATNFLGQYGAWLRGLPTLTGENKKPAAAPAA